jgi:hypothetical protein
MMQAESRAGRKSTRQWGEIIIPRISASLQRHGRCHLVEVDVWAEHQRGEITTPGRPAVRRPARQPSFLVIFTDSAKPDIPEKCLLSQGFQHDIAAGDSFALTGPTGVRRVDPDLLRHIGPVHFAGINFRGVFQFPLTCYRSRLIPLQ